MPTGLAVLLVDHVLGEIDLRGLLLAGVLALVMRVQLSLPLMGVLPQETYNQFFTMHGTIMMFLFAVPIVEAFAVLLLPSMVGTRDMPFPRLSAFGFWCYAIGGTLVFSSVLFGIAPDGPLTVIVVDDHLLFRLSAVEGDGQGR